MINLTPTLQFTRDDLEPTQNYCGDQAVTYFLDATSFSYFICEEDKKLGVLGLILPSMLSQRGLLWCGFYPGFHPNIRQLREAKSLGEVFFRQHDMLMHAEVAHNDLTALSFVLYFGFKPDVSSATRQLFVRTKT